MPGSDWRARYANWPALRKLEYMDHVMQGIAGRPPLVKTRRTPGALPSLRRTLRWHYRHRRQHYGVDQRDAYDRYLRQLFCDASADSGRPSAAAFLSRIRREVRRRVQRWTGEYQYLIDQVLAALIERCRELDLRLAGSEEEAKLEFTTLLTAQTMTRLHHGRHRMPL